MCTYCDTIGEGKLWYLNPKNHTRRIYRRKSRSKSGEPDHGAGTADVVNLGSLATAQLTAEMIRNRKRNPEKYREIYEKINSAWEKAKCQVVSIEDAFRVVEIATPLAILPCVCRRQHRATNENTVDKFTCMGLNVGITKWERWPERYHGSLEAGGVKFLTVDEAKEWIVKWEKRGMVPLIMNEPDTLGGLCMCDYPDCYAMRYRFDYDMSAAIVKGEYVAIVENNKCSGCGDCVSRCQFGAIKMEVTLSLSNIDPFKCFGCGLCESSCRKEAIKLERRTIFPTLRNVW